MFHQISENLAENSMDVFWLFLLFPFLRQGYLFERPPPILRRATVRIPSHLFAARFILSILGLLPFSGSLRLNAIDDLCPLDIADKFLVLAGGLGDFGAYSARPFGILSRYLLRQMVPTPSLASSIHLVEIV
jgi:hypothetical protein